MPYFIPHTPEGVAFLLALTEGPIGSQAECFLCQVVERRTSDTFDEDAPHRAL